MFRSPRTLVFRKVLKDNQTDENTRFDFVFTLKDAAGKHSGMHAVLPSMRVTGDGKQEIKVKGGSGGCNGCV